MGSSKVLLIFFFLHSITAFDSVAAQLDLWAHSCIDDNGSYTTNSTFESNLMSLFTKISTTDLPYGFYNYSAGKDPDQVYLIALCRGDVGVSDCHTCLDFVTSNLTGLCPNQKEVIGWADDCMLRYSSRDILDGSWETDPLFELINSDNVNDVDHFINLLQGLLNSVMNSADSGDSRIKYANGEASVTAAQKVYVLLQCNPDLSEFDCLGCLALVVSYLLHGNGVRGRIGARVLLPSCSARYQVQKFYSSPDPAPPPLPKLVTSGKRSDKSKILPIAAVSIIACLSLMLNVVLCCWLRRRTKPRKIVAIELDNVDEESSTESLQFDFGTIREATDNFSEANKLGAGGFGAVYKGVLTTGQQIAVKRLAVNSGQGESEFKNEVLLVAKLHHRNLLRILGFCLEGEERVLIYEFVSNGSLDSILFDATRRVKLDWETRYKIIGGIARGLLYLHEDSQLRIIHRDLKASNILLSTEMIPKICDFGMARLFGEDQTHARTGRIAEYARYGFFSVKSDVYSFGVILLEIVTGRRNIGSGSGESCEDLINLAWRNWSKGTSLDIVDSLTATTSSQSEMTRCIHIGLLCVQDSVSNRPTMSSVVHVLSDLSFDLQAPSQPPLVSKANFDAEGLPIANTPLLP